MQNKMIYYGGFIIIVTLVLTYIFTPIDLIPAKAAGAILGHLDDAAVVIAGLFALRKLRNATLGTKTQKGLGVKGYLIFLPFLTFGLWYIFSGVDIIPNAFGPIGWVDDILVIIAMFAIAARIRQKITLNTKRK